MRLGFAAIRGLSAGIIIGLFPILNADYTDASWLIDEGKYRLSVHGQISCQDCHSDILEKQPHPNPEEVNRTVKDFFRLEQCIDCHEDVLDDVEGGTHGGEKITNTKAFHFCIGCHDPHYQLSYSDSATPIHPVQPTEKKRNIRPKLQKELPKFSSADERCMGCHRFSSDEDPRAVPTIVNFCFHCHDRNSVWGKTGWYPLIDISAYRSTSHTEISCTICHLQAVEFKHGEQRLGGCRRCHHLHDEKVAHDAHFGVSCEACHLNQILPVKDAGSGRIRWQIDRRSDEISDVHQMQRSTDNAFCRRCHFSGNALGAAAIVLPAKSIICMPCHAATFSAGDITTVLVLIILGLGVLGLASVWFSGSIGPQNESGLIRKIISVSGAVFTEIFSYRIITIIKVLILDGLLQRRLFRISGTRWLAHALIFIPFVFRFVWGLTALISSLRWPEWSGAWLMLDRNHPTTAFLFDLSGALVILGVVLVIIRKHMAVSENIREALPRTDWPAFSLLGGIIVIGFILEGMRIEMTGTPGGSQYAFLGYAISRMFTEADLTGIYGYIWYVHAIFTGAFVAYVPFSRMFHMIMAPVSLAIDAAAKQPR